MNTRHSTAIRPDPSISDRFDQRRCALRCAACESTKPNEIRPLPAGHRFRCDWIIGFGQRVRTPRGPVRLSARFGQQNASLVTARPPLLLSSSFLHSLPSYLLPPFTTARIHTRLCSSIRLNISTLRSNPHCGNKTRPTVLLTCTIARGCCRAANALIRPVIESCFVAHQQLLRVPKTHHSCVTYFRNRSSHCRVLPA